MRLIFMGSPDFAIPSLQALHEAGHEIAAVYTQPPRPSGRGQKLQRQPVHDVAEALGIPVQTPARLRRNPEELEIFRKIGAEAAVVAAYGLILPSEILAAPTHGCLNIHASLLPRWRGASPIQSAIRAGDSESGVCIMQMDEGLDTGPVLLRETTPITADDTAGSLHDRLATIGAHLIVRALAENPRPVPQPDTGACYAPRLTRNDANIDWTRPAPDIERQIRAFTPWPGSITMLDGTPLRIGTVSISSVTGHHASPGTVMDDHLTVACGTGSLRIERLQKAGRAMMDAEAFLRGHPIVKGTRLA